MRAGRAAGRYTRFVRKYASQQEAADAVGQSAFTTKNTSTGTIVAGSSEPATSLRGGMIPYLALLLLRLRQTPEI